MNNPSVRIQAKPSTKHTGTAVRCVDGPHDGRMVVYQGRTVRLAVGGEPGRIVFGEYRFTSRPLGNLKRYEHYYQWFGPAPEPQAQRAAA